MGRPRPVARFAVYGQRRYFGAVTMRARIEHGPDRAAVARLTVREPGHVAEHPHGRPIAAIREPEGGGDGKPALAEARIRVAEPDALVADDLERQQAQRAVHMPGEKRLRPATQHMPSAHDAVYRKDVLRSPLPRDTEHVAARCGPLGRHRRIAEADRATVEPGDERGGFGRSARAPVRGPPPGVVLHPVACRAAGGAGEVSRL